MEKPLRKENKDLWPGQGLRASGWGAGWLQGHQHSSHGRGSSLLSGLLFFPGGPGLENRSFLSAGHARKLRSVRPLGERPLLLSWPCDWERPFLQPWSGSGVSWSAFAGGVFHDHLVE